MEFRTFKIFPHYEITCPAFPDVSKLHCHLCLRTVCTLTINMCEVDLQNSCDNQLHRWVYCEFSFHSTLFFFFFSGQEIVVFRHSQFEINKQMLVWRLKSEGEKNKKGRKLSATCGTMYFYTHFFLLNRQLKTLKG